MKKTKAFVSLKTANPELAKEWNYEKNGDLVRKISSYESQQENTKLQEFLENITLSVDNYDRTCKEYQSDSFYLLIKATNDNDKITTYEIPLKLDECN